MIPRLLPPLSAILIGMALAAVTSQASAEGVPARRSPSQYGSGCSVTGKLTLSTKLSCSGDAVRVEVVVKPQCALDKPNPVAWRRVQIRLPLPASIHPLDPPRSYQPDRNPTLERTFNAVPGRTAVGALSATWWIRSSEPGNYFIGEHAEVQLEDERGNLSATTLDATSLSVGATCVRPNTARLFLPILVQPRCQASDVPADIVLLLDQSSSLQPHDLEQTGQRARWFLDAVNLNRDRVAVIAFDQDARVLAPLGSSRTAVEQALGRLRLTPGTRIEVALQAAVGELTGGRSLPGRRRTIALISDGVNTSPHGDEPVVTWGGLTRAKGITIVTVAIGDRPNHALLDALADRPELALTAATSGDLDSAYRAVADVAACDWYDW